MYKLIEKGIIKFYLERRLQNACKKVEKGMEYIECLEKLYQIRCYG